MGFAENKKLAKDINTVNTECADRLGALMTQMSGRMYTANRILEGIASEETRTVYKPSVASEDTVCSNSKVSLYQPYQNPAKTYTEKHVLANVFKAKHDGEVTFYISCNWHQGRIHYIIRQTHPIEAVVFEEYIGNLYNGNAGAGSEIVTKNFSVVKDAVYQIEINLTVNASPGVNFYGSADATASIRAIEETITGTKTQYYYPSEGAPTIVELNKEYTYPESPSFNGGSRDIYLFTPEVSGAVDINIDILGYTKGDNYNQVTFTIKDSTGMNTLGAITSSNEKHVRYRFTVLAGEPYNLTVGYGGGDVISIGNISISAVKTSTLPVSVPFVPVEKPYQPVTFATGNQIKQGYVVAKLPESVYEKQPNLLIAMQGDVYPGSSPGYATMTFFNMATGQGEWYIYYEAGDTDGVTKGTNFLFQGTHNGYYNVYIATIDGEACVVVELNSSQQTIQDVAPTVGYISATLY